MKKLSFHVDLANAKMMDLLTILFSLTIIISLFCVLIAALISIKENTEFVSKSTLYLLSYLVISITILIYKEST